SIPFAVNPVLDHTGLDCAMGQSGPVWFLAGTNGFSTTRNCLIPAAKMIFFPIVNLGNDYPCPPPNTSLFRRPGDPNFQPGPGQSLEQFLTIGYGSNTGARQVIDHVTAISAVLDGVAIQGLFLPPENSSYRVTSSLFQFNGDPSLRAWDP